MLSNTANPSIPQGNNNVASFASRSEVVVEAQIGENKISVFRFRGRKTGSEVYVAEFAKKDEGLQLLVLPGSVAMIKNPINLEHYGMK